MIVCEVSIRARTITRRTRQASLVRRSDERVFGGKNLPTLSVVLHNS